MNLKIILFVWTIVTVLSEDPQAEGDDDESEEGSEANKTTTIETPPPTTTQASLEEESGEPSNIGSLPETKENASVVTEKTPGTTTSCKPKEVMTKTSHETKISMNMPTPFFFFFFFFFLLFIFYPSIVQLHRTHN